MGLFDIFKGKTSSGDPQQELIDKIIRRYFNGSKEKLQAEVKDLLEITKFDISFEQLSALLLCSLGYHGVNAKWSEKIHNQLKLLCRGKVPEVELKWLFDYCDLHYIHPNPSKEFLLLSEMAGRQIGMPAPHEVFSQKSVDDLPQNCGPVIIDSWPLIEFAREHGKMQVGEFANKETGEEFKSCIFTKPDGTRTFVAFSSKMGELTPKQIAALKDELQVVQLESGNYSLCKVGTHNRGNVDTNNNKKSKGCDGAEIDLGLSVLWSNMNIGASSESDYGLLYGYGDAGGKMTSENDYDYPQHDIVNTEYDIAKSNWGNSWRMPTSEELEELVNQCKWKKTIKDGIWGAQVIGPNGNSIFLPFAGVRMGKEVYRIGQIGLYWSGTMTKFGSQVELMYFGEDASLNGAAIAANGHSVRAVKDKTTQKDNECLRSIQIEKPIIKDQKRRKNTWSDEFGAKYSSDKNVLLKVPYILKEYSIKKGTTSISSKAFYGCTDIESIVIPSSIVKIESETFSGCTALWQIIIPNNVVSIGDGAFSKCTSLSSISFPNSVEHIGGGALFGCKGLTAIHIPANVKEIGEDVLCECKNLTSIVVDEKNNYYDSRNQCNAIIESNSNTLIAGCSSTVIPNGVLKIAHQAFGGSTIKSVVIPDSVSEIGPSAFCACEELQSVEISGSVEVIGQLAFCGCKSITTITIPDGIKEIGDSVFMGCENLNIVLMSDCVETIGKDIFYGCKNLTQIYVNKGGKEKIERFLPDYKDIIVEQFATPEATSEIEDDWWTDGNGIPYIIDVMPNSSNSIGEKICNSFTSETDNADLEKKSEEGIANTFIDKFGVEYSSDKKVLKKVPKEITDYSILEGTEIIGDAAFSNCEDLVSVSIPNSIYEIGHYAFAGCKKIFSFIIPRGVKAIGDGAFMNCETLKSLRLSEGLVSISDDAFVGCNNLYTIFVPVEEKIRFEVLLSKFDVNIAEYNSDNVGALDEILSGLLDESGVLYSKDGKTVFTHTKELSSYTIKNGTEFINAKAFSPIDGVDNNLSLKEIFLPDTIAAIGELAFANNEGLKEISLPASIKSIGKDVFKGCKSLSCIRIPHGTRAKFERLLPEWKNILVEKIGIVSDTLSDFELPDGSIYNGRCFRNPFGSVVLDGIGSLSYPNGDKYKGNFKNGRPYGWGIYWFKNGKHSHKGFFDDLPKGIGYLNEDYDMAVGNFFEGRLHGWAVCYRNRILKFGYWEKGKLIKDETNKTLWIRKQISHERAYYQGNLIQIDNKHEYIRFGVPPKIIGEKIPGIPESQLPKMPAWGFEFFKDGSVKVGAIRNHDSGEFTMYYPDGRSELGKWQEGVKTSSFTIDWLQKPVDEYEVDGLDVF